MLHAFGAFSAMFSFLAIVVQLGGLARFFGGGRDVVWDRCAAHSPYKQTRAARPGGAAALTRNPASFTES